MNDHMIAWLSSGTPRWTRVLIGAVLGVVTGLLLGMLIFGFPANGQAQQRETSDGFACGFLGESPSEHTKQYVQDNCASDGGDQ